MVGVLDWTVDQYLGGQPQVIDLRTNIVCISSLLLRTISWAIMSSLRYLSSKAIEKSNNSVSFNIVNQNPNVPAWDDTQARVYDDSICEEAILLSRHGPEIGLRSARS